MSFSIPISVQIVLMILLILFSALFSGLTLGLMGLDKTGLEIVMEGDDQIAAKNAKEIYPVRVQGNLLLCTLLLGNVAVNSMLSILMADFSSGLMAFFVSTGLIVIFGEILPQALCQRYALSIGSRSVPIVKVIRFILYPIAAPLAFILDKVLGTELGTIYTKSEMKKLIKIHMERGGFDKELGSAMQGALKYQDLQVKDVMTPIEKVFLLSVEEKLSFKTIAAIFKSGFSRIPVYEVSVNNIIGLLFVKDLIFVDPKDETPVRNFVQIFGRGVHVIWPDDKLGDVLRELKKGRSHMALVRDVNNEDEAHDPYYEIKGIITLEDIIEEILGDEIVDETDVYVHAEDPNIKVDRTGFDWARLRLLDSKLVEERLSKDEVAAVCAHLNTNHKECVSELSQIQLATLVASTPVSKYDNAEQDVGEELPTELLYEKDTETDVCTIVFTGKITILAGKDKFRSDIGSWSVLAPNALIEDNYTPDFTAYVSEQCRCLRLSRRALQKTLHASFQLTKSSAAKTVVARGRSFDDPAIETLTDNMSRGRILLTEINRIESQVDLVNDVQHLEELQNDCNDNTALTTSSLTTDGEKQARKEMNLLQKELTSDGHFAPLPTKTRRKKSFDQSESMVTATKQRKDSFDFIESGRPGGKHKSFAESAFGGGQADE